MRISMKFLIFGALAVVAITGCARKESAKVAASVDQDFLPFQMHHMH